MLRTRSAAWLTWVAAVTLSFIPPGGGYAQEPASTEAYIDSLRGARDSLMSARDFEAALAPAELIVEELEQSAEKSSAADKIMLAVILAELGRNEEAEGDLLNVIESLQNDEGLYTEAIVTPLRLLGRTYIRARQFPQAITALTEARTVSRRNLGLFNVDQVGVLDDLTTAHLGLGDTMTARDLQIERLELAQRQYGTDDLRVIPYHNHLADYYERSRLLSSADEQFHEALQIATAQGDWEQTLIARRNIVSLSIQMASKEPMPEELQSMVADAPPTASRHELGLAHAVLGDVALINEDYDVANGHYASAWRLIESGGALSPTDYFADPVPIRFIAPLTPVDRAQRSLPYTWGTIAFDFDVDEKGRVKDINGVGAQPPDLMEAAYEERLRSAWFRPSLVNAEPHEAQGVILTHYFRYYVEPDEDED